MELDRCSREPLVSGCSSFWFDKFVNRSIRPKRQTLRSLKLGPQIESRARRRVCAGYDDQVARPPSSPHGDVRYSTNLPHKTEASLTSGSVRTTPQSFPPACDCDVRPASTTPLNHLCSLRRDVQSQREAHRQEGTLSCCRVRRGLCGHRTQARS